MVAMAEAVSTAEELKRAIREVRSDIFEIVTKIEEIKLQQIPQIENDYAIKIGCWEKGLLEAEVAARRAKRRYALIQAQVNQGNTPQYESIEAQLDEELSDWTARVEEAQTAYEQALAWHMARVPMAPADAEELHKLYRTLMKRLHPAGQYAVATSDRGSVNRNNRWTRTQTGVPAPRLLRSGPCFSPKTALEREYSGTREVRLSGVPESL